MSRPVTCVVGIHPWQLVDYDDETGLITLECRKCGTRREKHKPRTALYNRSDGPDNFGR